MNLELCINNARAVNMIHSRSDNQRSNIRNKNKHTSSRYNESDRLFPFTCGKSKRPRRMCPIYREYEGRIYQVLNTSFVYLVKKGQEAKPL